MIKLSCNLTEGEHFDQKLVKIFPHKGFAQENRKLQRLSF